MSKGRFIAFDLGLNFGYSDGKISGCIRVSDKKRMFSFYSTVLDLLVTKRNGSPYRAIVHERPYFIVGRVTAATIYNINAQRGILQLLAESLNMDFIDYTPTEIKKAFTGDGKADKKQMIKKANEHTRKNITNDNEADAIAVYYTHKNK